MELIDREWLLQRGMPDRPVNFEAEISRFCEEDRAAPPAGGGVLFVGDSDVRRWNEGGRFASDFAGLPVLNRGFGGARTWEVLAYFSRIVLPHRPRVIVYNCGDNDIACLKTGGAASAVTGFRLFLELAERHLPEARKILYLGIHPSPRDEPLWGCIDEANAQLRPLCRSSARAEFLDYTHLLCDEHRRPRPEFFAADRLHFTAEFYRIWGAWLRPGIERALES